MRFLDVFAGIGGMSRGLEFAGWHCVGHVEAAPYCRSVLERHWPAVWQRGDIRLVSGADVRAGCGPVDAVVGGPPCQPASVAGKRAGKDDRRWLWAEFLRLVREISPRWVLAENPTGLVSLRPHGLDWVCSELESAGYEVTATIVGARHVGAPHRRDRVWIVGRRVADAAEHGGGPETGWDEVAGPDTAGPASGIGGSGAAELGDAAGARRAGDGSIAGTDGRQSSCRPSTAGAGVADASSTGQPGRRGVSGGAGAELTELARSSGDEGLADPNGVGFVRGRRPGRREDGQHPSGDDTLRRDSLRRWPARPGEEQHEWEEPRVLESRVVRAAHGIPGGLARRHALKALGNAVVPQCSEALGRAILAADE